MSEIAKFGDTCDATVTRGAGATEIMGLEGVYEAVCYDKDGNIKWQDTIQNLTTNVGRQNLLQFYFVSPASTNAIVMGLMGASGGSSTPAYTDTQSSHSGWLEVGGTNAPTYSGTRKTPSFTTTTTANPAVLATSASVVFNMTSSGTVYGAFINASGSSTIDNTTGTLFSAGNFTAGSKTVSNGDTINVSYTLSAAG